MIESELQGIELTNLKQGLAKFESSSSEYWEFLLMIGFGNYSETDKLFKTLISKISDHDWRKPLVDIGQARYLSISGRSFECLSILEKAEERILSRYNFLNDEIHAEIRSLYYYTRTTFLEKINSNIERTTPQLINARSLTSIESFKLAFDYRIAHNEVLRRNYPVSHILESIYALENSKLWILACMGYRAAGIVSRIRNDNEAANTYFEKAMDIANRFDLAINKQHIQMAITWLLFTEKRYQDAEQLLREIKINNEVDPIQSIYFENLSLIARAESNHDQSISEMKRALEISIKLDSVNHVPGECQYLGDMYRNHYHDLDQAEHYYKLGYDHAMRYAAHGISLTGDRKDVVDAYVNFINHRKKNTAGSPKSAPADHFRFAQGKPWREIKDIFHHELIKFHGEHEKNSKHLAIKLNMPASTLYSLQDRLKTRGLLESSTSKDTEALDHDLHPYLDRHQDLNWYEVNEIFEREMMHYLYEKYGYNKHRMAKVLKLSYPSIINKTRDLTQIDDHLFPN